MGRPLPAGIRSGFVVIDQIEDPAEWEAVRQGVREAIDPADFLEEMLAERLALNLWKRRRIDYYQAAITRRWVDCAYDHLQLTDDYKRSLGAEVEAITETRLFLEQTTRLLGTDEDLQKLLRYEGHLHRQTLQFLHELEAMKTRREGGVTPLARLDITGPPGT